MALVLCMRRDYFRVWGLGFVVVLFCRRGLRVFRSYRRGFVCL